MQRKTLVGIILAFYCVYRLLRADDLEPDVVVYELSTTKAVLVKGAKIDLLIFNLV